MAAVVSTSNPDLTTAPREHLVSVRKARKYFPIREGVLQRVTGHVKAVDGISFDIRRGETVGLVGESGCGKSTLGRCIAGLMKPTGGGVYFGLNAKTRDRLDALLALESDRRSAQETAELDILISRYRVDGMKKTFRAEYRRNCQMVFQNNFASLNPRQQVRDIVGRPLKIHDEASGTQLTERVVDLLEEVGLGRQHLFRYPHQFSGGQRQRISVARALALRPEFVVLDEPTSALDVSVQAQILNLLHELQEAHDLTYLFISHDLDVVRHMSDRIVVMYVGEMCEVGSSDQLFDNPAHPYTEALLDANPSLDETGRSTIRLAGTVPDPADPPSGCRFHTRCPVAIERCGWDVADALAVLDDSDVSEALTGVRRHSPFDAELAFDSADDAGAAVAELRSARTSESMKRAVAELKAEGSKVHLSFLPVDGTQPVSIGDGHQTACILHTDRDRQSSGS